MLEGLGTRLAGSAFGAWLKSYAWWIKAVVICTALVGLYVWDSVRSSAQYQRGKDDADKTCLVDTQARAIASFEAALGAISSWAKAQREALEKAQGDRKDTDDALEAIQKDLKRYRDEAKAAALPKLTCRADAQRVDQTNRALGHE